MLTLTQAFFLREQEKKKERFDRDSFIALARKKKPAAASMEEASEALNYLKEQFGKDAHKEICALLNELGGKQQ